MSDLGLTPERILDSAEEVLRRFGPGKTTVVDVARALGVSHGAVYRHFDTKAALRDAVAARWLARVSAPLDKITAETGGDATGRLRRWLDALIAGKHRLLREEPELFATYVGLAMESREVVAAHVGHLIAGIATILAAGDASGEFSIGDLDAAARAVLDATARFHNPAHAAEWTDPTIDAAFDAVFALVLRGLKAR